jgi:uncharacterized protein HemX
MVKKYDYDENGDRVVRETTVVTEGSGSAGAGVGVVAIIVAIALAIGGWFYFNGQEDTPASVSTDIKQGVERGADAVKDGAAEIPQAGKDATTSGDQSTTRPNSDGSTGQLDQK